MAATREASAQATLDPTLQRQALYPKLRPGPGMSAQEVASHQRARIHGAMIEIAGERGYGAVTMRELTRLAGVSTRAFYEHFEDKEDCFLRTCEEITRQAIARVIAAQKSEHSWQAQLRAGSLAYARALEAQPQAARMAMLEALTAGPVALEQTRGFECMFEMLIAESFARAPDQVEVPPVVVEGIAAGVEGVARAYLLAGRERELPDLVDGLLEWALCYRNETAAQVARVDGRSTSTSVSQLGENGSAGSRVVGDERERILSAVAKLVTVNGYEQLTVPRIRIEAGVSRRCFDANFESVGECFLAAVELRISRAFSYAEAAAANSETWASGVHRAINTICAAVTHDPTLAKLAFVEVYAPGLEGMRCRERLVAKIAKRFRESAPPEQRPNELVAVASIEAVWGVVHHRIVSGRARQLSCVGPALSLLALAPVIGAPAAAQAISSAGGV